MKHYVDKYVMCPFYSQEEPLKMHCEGFFIGTRVHICFDCKERLKAYKKKYCRDFKGSRQCPLYKLIDSQYEERED